MKITIFTKTRKCAKWKYLREIKIFHKKTREIFSHHFPLYKFTFLMNYRHQSCVRPAPAAFPVSNAYIIYSTNFLILCMMVLLIFFAIFFHFKWLIGRFPYLAIFPCLFSDEREHVISEVEIDCSASWKKLFPLFFLLLPPRFLIFHGNFSFDSAGILTLFPPCDVANRINQYFSLEVIYLNMRQKHQQQPAFMIMNNSFWS